MRSLLALLVVATAPVSAQPIDRSPAAARATVQHYYAAIDRGDYRTAYRLWNGNSGKSFATFEQGFARTAHSRVVAGTPVDQEGAAGSIFITVPVRVDATLKNGARQRFAGSYVLRRVNDVEGATPDDLRWSLFSAKLHTVR